MGEAAIWGGRANESRRLCRSPRPGLRCAPSGATIVDDLRPYSWHTRCSLDGNRSLISSFLLFIYLFGAVRVLRQYERGVRFNLGKI